MNAEGKHNITATGLWSGSLSPSSVQDLLLPTAVCLHRTPPASDVQPLQLTLRSVLRPSIFLHTTKDISMSAPVLPLLSFMVIFVTMFLPKKSGALNWYFTRLDTPTLAHGVGVRCAEAPSVL